MGLTIPTGYANAAFIHSERNAELGTEPFVWTLGLDISGVGESLQETANNLVELWTDTFASQTADEYQLDRVDLTVGAPGGGTGSVSSTLPPVPGERSIDPSYSCFAPKVRKVTALVGRKYRGVFHPPGMLAISEVNSNGAITATRLGGIQTVVDEFGLAIAGLFESGGVILHTGEEAPTPISGVLVQSKVGILRNRML